MYGDAPMHSARTVRHDTTGRVHATTGRAGEGQATYWESRGGGSTPCCFCLSPLSRPAALTHHGVTRLGCHYYRLITQQPWTARAKVREEVEGTQGSHLQARYELANVHLRALPYLCPSRGGPKLNICHAFALSRMHRSSLYPTPPPASPSSYHEVRALSKTRTTYQIHDECVM